MTAFVFPGQGSQKRGMGQSLFDNVPEFRAVEDQVDSLMGYSIRRCCLEDPNNCLTDTRYTQPCLYVVNALHCYRAIAAGARPQYLAGHSFGEYNALLAAGVFDFLTGLRIVKRRGEIMSQAKDGGMAAVVGLPTHRVAEIIQDNELVRIDVANFNSPSQVVISGPSDDIRSARPLFEAAGARLYVPLRVSAAFHSRYMTGASEEFSMFLRPMQFAAPRIPVIANVTAQFYPPGCTSEFIREMLVKQITRSVRWTQSIALLMARGVTEFHEVGPGNVLTRLIQDVRSNLAAQWAAADA